VKQRTLCDLGNQVAAARDTLHSSNKSILITNGELSKLNYNKHQLENFIASLKSDNEQYGSFRNDVEKQMRQTLSDNKMILLIAVISVLEVLREDPNKQWLIYDGLDDPPCTLPAVPLGLNSQQYRQLCLTILVELAEEVFNKLLNRSVDILISSVVARPKTVSDTQM